MTPQELRQEVFNYFSNEHNLHLLESEYDYVINLCQNQ